MADQYSNDLALQAAENYRSFWEERPGLAIASGFTPFLGTALGVADFAAALKDPRAGAMETILTGLGILPVVGGVAKLGIPAAKAIAISAKGTERLEAADKIGEVFGKIVKNTREGKPVSLAEIMDNPQAWDMAKVAKGGRFDMEDIIPDTDPIFIAYPELRRLKINVNKSPEGTFDLSGKYDPMAGKGKWGEIDINLPDEFNIHEAVRGILHETQHVIANIEGMPNSMLGTNSRWDGWVGYLNNAGEKLARTAGDRAYMSRTAREAVDIGRHMDAETQRLGENLATNSRRGRLEGARQSGMSDPQVAEAYANRSVDVGLTGPQQQALAGPVWTNPPPAPDEFGRTLRAGELNKLLVGDDVSRTLGLPPGARDFDPSGTSQFRTQRQGGPVRPPTVQAEWLPKSKTWNITGADRSSLETWMATYKNYGPNTEIPVRFVTKDGKPLTQQQRQAAIANLNRPDTPPMMGRNAWSESEPPPPRTDARVNFGQPLSPAGAAAARDAPPFDQQMDFASTIIRQMKEARTKK